MNRTLQWLRTRRVAVLKGGWSRERPISLKTGAAIESALKRFKIPSFGIDVKPQFLSQIRSEKIDFCYIALHGEFGEDGGVQAMLDLMGIPYTGSDALGSALAMDKILSKERFVKAGIPTPKWMSLTKDEYKSSPRNAIQSIEHFLKSGPVFIKPVNQGSAIGAGRVERSSQIRSVLLSCFRVAEEALIEMYIAGRELTVGILDGKALPVVEIVPEHSFYDFHSKYAKGGSRHLVPAPLPRKRALLAQKLSLKAFRAVRCSVYGRVDVLMEDNGRMHVLEVNTIPGMTDTSLLPDAARAVGMNFDQLVLKIAEASLKARGVFK